MRINSYRLNTVPGLMTLVLLAASLGWAQEISSEKLNAWVAEVKESIAQSKESLRQYTWVETTEISLKGDVKSRKQNDCRYGPDGTVQKTPTTASEEQKKKRGLKGKIVAKKKEASAAQASAGPEMLLVFRDCINQPFMPPARHRCRPGYHL